MQKRKSSFYLKKSAQGTILSLIIIMLFIYTSKDDLYSKFLLYETLPYISIEKEMLFKMKDEEEITIDDKKVETFIETSVNESEEIIGTHNVIFQDDTKNEVVEKTIPEKNITDINQLKDFDYLVKNFYTVDSTTEVTENLLNIDKFLNTDLKIDNNISGPKILLFHTHINENFIDSDPDNLSDGIMGFGERLKAELEEKYNIEVLHYTSNATDNKVNFTTAYEDIEPPIRKVINDNPSIQVAIDLHRDGFNIIEGQPYKKVVTEVNNKPTAKIMFFNGLTRLKQNGAIKNLISLPNPNLETNLALSFNMQLKANELFPDFTRKIYLKPYRYSLHMIPKSLLIEVGANTNTKEEIFNAVEPLAKILSEVVN